MLTQKRVEPLPGAFSFGQLLRQVRHVGQRVTHFIGRRRR
jgi:hypothetical protein